MRLVPARRSAGLAAVLLLACASVASAELPDHLRDGSAPWVTFTTPDGDVKVHTTDSNSDDPASLIELMAGDDESGLDWVRLAFCPPDADDACYNVAATHSTKRRNCQDRFRVCSIRRVVGLDVPSGQYTVIATAKDQANNLGHSQPITVTIV